MQDTWLTVLDKLDGFEGRSTLKTWVCGILVNKAGRCGVRDADKDLRRVIDAAVAALPTRQRELITARDVVGMDAAEVALVLGLSNGNRRVLLHRARSKVRAALERYAAAIVEEPPRPTRPAGERS